MIKPRDYDSAEARTSFAEDIPQPTPGGHGCIIYKAETVRDDYGEKMVLSIDIHENGEFDDYYKKRYNRALSFDKSAKWPGLYRQPILTKDGATSPFFKGLITSIENSNSGYRWNWDENSLKGKKVGMVFRPEQYKGKTDGAIHTTVRPAFACDYDSVDAMPVPKMKPYVEKKTSSSLFPETQMTPADSDPDLPF